MNSPSPGVRGIAAHVAVLWVVLALVSGCAASPSGQVGRTDSTPLATAVPATATATATTVVPTATALPGGWTLYTDAQFHFSLQVPADWRSSTNDSGYHSAQFQGTAPSGDNAILFIAVTDVPNRITLAEQQFCTSATTTTVAGFPAVVSDSNPPPGTGTGGSKLERLFDANGLFYIIQLLSFQPLDQLQQRLGDFYAHILASFQPGPGEPGNVICL